MSDTFEPLWYQRKSAWFVLLLCGFALVVLWSSLAPNAPTPLTRESDILNLMSDNDRPLVLEFVVAGCTYCRKATQILERAVAANPAVNFRRIDLDDAPSLAAKFEVSVAPTTLVIEGGTVIARSAFFDSAGLAAAISHFPTN